MYLVNGNKIWYPGIFPGHDTNYKISISFIGLLFWCNHTPSTNKLKGRKVLVQNLVESVWYEDNSKNLLLIGYLIQK